jgi:CHAT domain-containing protein
VITGEREPKARAEAALAQLAPAWLGLDRLRVIPSGELTSVDFHALPATQRLSVSYSLGLGRPTSEARSHERRASVVVGSRDLAAARDEGREVADALARSGWTVDTSWSPEAAVQPTLLHYAGHGVHAGPDGWDSHIEVPGHGRLSAAHIVALQRAPALVVLGACSTGATRDDILDGGMNLAVALLLAGAEIVIAPSGPVEDRAALALARLLHGDTAPTSASLLQSLASAQSKPRSKPDSKSSMEAESFVRWRAWVP